MRRVHQDSWLDFHRHARVDESLELGGACGADLDVHDAGVRERSRIRLEHLARADDITDLFDGAFRAPRKDVARDPDLLANRQSANRRSRDLCESIASCMLPPFPLEERTAELTHVARAEGADRPGMHNQANPSFLLPELLGATVKGGRGKALRAGISHFQSLNRTLYRVSVHICQP